MDDTVSGIPPDVRDLFDAARRAQARSHAPYSRYPVGAAIRTASGAIFAGCNVENASYPEGHCAETAAIAAMVLAGDRGIVEILTVTKGPHPGAPCGGCRQRIREFGDSTTMVHSTTERGAHQAATLGELLPSSFGPEFLPEP